MTLAALMARNQISSSPHHFDRALDHGLTQAEAGEALTQLAFYAGWPTVFSALPVVREVLQRRPE